MALMDVKERIRKKKQRRRRRILFVLTIIVLTALGVTAMTSSWLDVKKISFNGNTEIPTSFLDQEAKVIMGENLLLVSKNDVLTFLGNHPYYQDVQVKKKFPDEIVLEISEKVAEVNYINQGVVNLLTKEGILLETATNLLEGGLMLLDHKILPEEGENIYSDDESIQKIVQEFRELQIRNRSEIEFDTLDLREMTNIKTYYEDLEIWLGYPESIKEKLNAAINIILDGQIHSTVGYIDVSYLENPVVFDESLMTPQEPIETPQEPIETPAE